MEPDAALGRTVEASSSGARPGAAPLPFSGATAPAPAPAAPVETKTLSFDEWRNLLRSGLVLVSMLSWFWALPHVVLADAVALNYTGPLFVTVGAVLLLGR